MDQTIIELIGSTFPQLNMKTHQELHE